MMPAENKPRILVVEDDASLARFLELELNHQGYETAMAAGGYEAVVKAAEGGWDLVILDLMLPGLDGFEVCRRLREHSFVPVIMLTARGAVADRVKGLDTGADDYLTKPFATEELLARIRVCLRRHSLPVQAGRKIVYGDLTVSPDNRQVERGGRQISLSKKEFEGWLSPKRSWRPTGGALRCKANPAGAAGLRWFCPWRKGRFNDSLGPSVIHIC